MHVFLTPGRRLVIAHRGGAGRRPENTMAAFDWAAGLGVDAIELDLQLSREGDAMVIHDSTLDRTTDAIGPVASLTAAALARVDAGYRFAAPGQPGVFPFRGQGIGVPTLAAVLARHPGMRFTVELKGNEPALADRAIEVVRAAGAVDRVSFGSFHWSSLRRIRASGIGCLTSASVPEALAARVLAVFGVPPVAPAYDLFQLPEYRHGWHVVTERFVRLARRASRPVQVWVVNDRADMVRLLGWGVTAIISDVPDVAMDAVYSAAEGAHG